MMIDEMLRQLMAIQYPIYKTVGCIIKSKIAQQMQGPLQQQISPKVEQNVPSPTMSGKTRSGSSEITLSAISSQTSFKQSPIEQQILELKCVKINLNDEGMLINFINKIIHLVSEAMTNFKPKYMTEIVNLFLTKITMVNYISSMAWDQKRDQINKWTKIELPPAAANFCINIVCYIIEEADLANFLEAITLLYFLLFSKLNVEKSTLLALSWSIQKFTNSSNSSTSKANIPFIKHVATLIINIIKQYPICSAYTLKVYINCIIFLLKFLNSKQQLQGLESHLCNYCLIQQILFSSQMDKNQLLSEEKENFFIQACQVYAITGSKKLWRIVQMFIEAGVTLTMLSNCWNLFNADQNLAVFNIDCLKRLSEILDFIKQKCNDDPISCVMSPKGTWISKQIEKRTSMIIFRFALTHPAEANQSQNHLILRLNMELGTIQILARVLQSDPKSYCLVVKKYSRQLNSDSQPQQLQQLQIKNFLQCCTSTLAIQFREEKKLWICSHSERLAEVNYATMGRSLSIFVGVREQEIRFQSILKRIYSFVILENIKFEQYLKQKNSSKLNEQSSKLNLKQPLKRHNSENNSGPVLQFDLLEAIETNQRNRPADKLKIPNKSLTYSEIEVSRNQNFQKMVSRFGGKKKLPSYILNALEVVRNDQVLELFIEILRKYWTLFEMSDEDFHELSFLHGHSLFLKKPFTLVNQLIQFAHTLRDEDSNKTSQRKIRENQRILQFKLQIVLKTFLEIQNNANESTFLQKLSLKIIQQYFSLNQSNLRQNGQAAFKLCFLINAAIMGCTNDYALERLQLSTASHQIISNQVQGPKKSNQLQIGIENKDNINKFMRNAKDCLKCILEKTKSDAVLVENIALFLELTLVTLSHICLKGQVFDRHIIYSILKHNCQILQNLSLQLAKAKIVSESDQNKICCLLSQMYNILPALCCYYSKKSDGLKQFYQKFYTEIYDRESRVKQDQFLLLMCDYYQACFHIGSFCLKNKKNGFLTYMTHAYQFLSTYKDNLNWDENTNVLTYGDRITITQLYSSCWKFIVYYNSKDRQCYSLDKETQIQVIQKLNDLCLPIYYLESPKKKSLIRKIVQHYTFFCPQEDFPLNLLANVQPCQIESILSSICKQIQARAEQSKQEKAAQIIYLLNLINSYPDYIKINVDLSSYEKPKYKQIWRVYHFYQIFSQIKIIFSTLKQMKQLTNSKQSPQKISEALKKVHQMTMQKFKDDPLFTNVKYLLNNFVSAEDEDEQDERKQENYLPFVEVLLHQFEQVNINISSQLERPKKEKRKEIQILSAVSKQQTPYFCTERSSIKQESEVQVQQVSKKVGRKIFAQNCQYFTKVYSRLVKNKNNALIAYYKMIERLSFEEKLYNIQVSEKYKIYDYYILDDYLNNSDTKVMLKKDPVSILSNFFTNQIPRLYEQEQVSNHTLYALKITVSIKDLNDNPFFLINLENELKLSQDQQKEQKGRATIFAVLVTKSKIYQGKIEIGQKNITFTENTVIDNKIYKAFFANKSEYRTLQEISVSRKTVSIDVTEANYSVKKRYLQKFPALQVYDAHLSYFFVFSKENEREKFLSLSGIFYPQPYELDELLNQAINKWKNGWISNFSLLTTINNLSGRSFNDVSQYYVFPWTVLNFHDPMDQQFFKKKQNFRDLSKPIGSLNPTKIKTILSKYENFSNNQQSLTQKPYMFGSFYSNPGVVCNYLLRVNPFTIHHYELQGNQFDLYDRLFTNMEDQLESIRHSIMDNRELLPQFYCAPEFFRNRNRYNFAHSHPKENKCDLAMKMPKWVITRSPQQFVFRMRKVLQSNVVSSQLGGWIDLIFGYKSEEENAAEHNNLYVHQLYRPKAKKSTKQFQLVQSEIDSKSSMIKLFGQVPKNIFGNKPSLMPVGHSIATSIFSQKKQHKKILTSESGEQQEKPVFLFSSRQSFLAMSDKSTLTLFNENDEIKTLKVNIEQPFQSLSLLLLKKSDFFLLFGITISGSLQFYNVKISKARLLSTKSEFKIEKRAKILEGVKFSQIKVMQKYVIIAQQTCFRLLQINKQKSGNTIQTLSEGYFLKDKGHISLHRSPIISIETYDKLQIIISIDASGLINVFNVQPELSVRSTFSLCSALKVSEKITKILPHQMGILVLLTSFNQVIVCNIYGDLIQRVYVADRIADMVLWDDQSSSEILISTNTGLIYQFDLFQMVQKAEDCLLGLTIQIKGRKNVETLEKCGNKLAIHRFGRFWQLYILSSRGSVSRMNCENFHKNYAQKLFNHNCNHNNTYKNT